MIIHDFMMLLVCTQYFNYIHYGHNNINLISQNNVAKETRANVSNKACIQESSVRATTVFYLMHRNCGIHCQML